jgi:hypothetical protein
MCWVLPTPFDELSTVFNQNGMKTGEALLSLLFKFSLEYINRAIQEN